MVDKPASPAGSPAAPSNQAPDAAHAPRRPFGHRGADMRDAVAELAERAQVISQEAGSKVAAAMKDVISAAAGIAGFAIESARDLVQYMVRRGQMTPEEGEKLIREVEAAHSKRPASEKARPTATKVAADRAAAAKADAAARAAAQFAAAPPRVAPRPEPSPPQPSSSHRAPAKPPAAPHAKDAEKKTAVPKAAGKSAKAEKSAKPAKAPSPKLAKPVKTAKKKK